MEPRSFGDSILLMCLAWRWHVKITVLDASSLRELRFRHDTMINQADFVLVYNGKNHFVAASK